jgi:transposase-like protein
MAKNNIYAKNAKISTAKFRRLLKFFAVDLNATQIAELTGLHRNTVNRYLKAIRESIAEYCETESPFTGTVEVDESYFGAKRVRGKRGRGALGKTKVFGIFKRNGSVYTEIVPDCSAKTLLKAIRGRVSLDSIIHSDGWRGYNGLVDVGYAKHYRVNHDADEFANENSTINGIEGFWGVAKSRLAKFKGLSKSTFYLHLKECEFRFNYRNDDIYKKLLAILRKNSLF